MLGIAAFYVAAFAAVRDCRSYFADAGIFAFAALGAALLHAIWLIVTLDPDRPGELPDALSRQLDDRMDRLRRARRRRDHQVLKAARLLLLSGGR